jgi:hypothetical protein
MFTVTIPYTVDYSSNFKYLVFNIMLLSSQTQNLYLYLMTWKGGQVELTKLKSDETQGLELQGYLQPNISFSIYSDYLI